MTKDLLKEIEEELKRARQVYHSFHSNHEGYAVLKEEVDELWDLVKQNKSVQADNSMRKECIQIAAMAIRFIEDLYK
jgi:1-aminocyclopropane-1-carboxylate deaminase/D-cysteine desulfhydrase-like pyridoxal-dependent ACC family enzyme